jgi:multiple antibiotic resistance protein
MIDFVATFIIFFAVVDPIGTVPVFMSIRIALLPRARVRAKYFPYFS